MTRVPSASPSAGFTLIEVMIALAIFGIIGVMAHTLTTEILRHQEAAVLRGERLGELQRALQIVQRDILTVTGRSVRDELGDRLPALLINPEGFAELTRAGWRNPLQLPRAELQRVGYALTDGTLYRVYWPVLDRAPDTEPVQQELLRDVEDVAFFAIDRAGNEHGFWPLENVAVSGEGGQARNPERELAALGIRFSAEPWGELERVWMVPAL